MNVDDLEKDTEMKKFIEGIRSHKMFPALKDAFVSHTPGGEREANQSGCEHPLVLAHGKVLGTRYVFNEIERIASIQQQPKKQESRKGEGDPDLAT